MTVKKFLAYTGHLNLDVVMMVDEINDNITLPVDSVEENFGGTAGNFAITASRIGLDFRLYSIISGRSHKSYINKLHELNIDMTGVKVVEGSFGPVCYAINDGKNQKYFLAEGPMKEEKYDVLDESYKILHLGTGNPELNIQMVHEGNYDKLAFDPSQEVFFKYSSQELNYFLNECDIILGNKSEIEFIFRKADVSLNEYRDSDRVVIMTNGEKGTVLYSDEITNIDIYKKVVNTGNTLGAGDSFRAGFYRGLLEGMDYANAIALGNVVSYNVVNNGLWGDWPSVDSLITQAKDIKIDTIK